MSSWRCAEQCAVRTQRKTAARPTDQLCDGQAQGRRTVDGSGSRKFFRTKKKSTTTLLHPLLLAAAAAAAEEEDYEMPPPIPPLDPLAWNASAMQPPPLPAAKRRVACGIEAGTSFSDFLEARQKKPCVGGPGRSAAPVKRHLTREQVTLAFRGGLASQRAAYAYAYGYESTSGNLAWLRRKIEEAVEDA